VASEKVIKEAANPLFCQRVAFLALLYAQQQVEKASPDGEDTADLIYARQIFRGEEKALLLTLHVVAANTEITDALENGTAADVQDGSITAALEAIWSSRAQAFAATDLAMGQMRHVMSEIGRVSEEVARASQAVQQASEIKPQVE
jgi:hypothetical protein